MEHRYARIRRRPLTGANRENGDRPEDWRLTLDFGDWCDKMQTLEVASHLRFGRFPVAGGGVCSLINGIMSCWLRVEGGTGDVEDAVEIVLLGVGTVFSRFDGPRFPPFPSSASDLSHLFPCFPASVVVSR